MYIFYRNLLYEKSNGKTFTMNNLKYSRESSVIYFSEVKRNLWQFVHRMKLLSWCWLGFSTGCDDYCRNYYSCCFASKRVIVHKGKLCLNFVPCFFDAAQTLTSSRSKQQLCNGCGMR